MLEQDEVGVRAGPWVSGGASDAPLDRAVGWHGTGPPTWENSTPGGGEGVYSPLLTWMQ